SPAAPSTRTPAVTARRPVGGQPSCTYHDGSLRGAATRARSPPSATSAAEVASRRDAFYMRANGRRVDPSLQLMRGGGLQDDVGAEAVTLLSVVHRPYATGVQFVA